MKVMDVIILWILITLNVWVLIRFDKRITALEAQCHAQCTYGDDACTRMCDKKGHCPFQK